MKKYLILLIALTFFCYAETLFEVKDASNNKVLDVSNDGLRVFNLGDTLMVISPTAIKAFIRESDNKVLSRTFSVTTATSKKGLANALEIGSDYTNMSSTAGKYTDFSPLNLFLGLNSGQKTVPNPNPFNAGDQTTWEGKFNIFIGNESGRDNVNGYFNLFVGDKAGQLNNGGQKNTFVGSQAGQANVSGGYNSHFGYNSGITSTGYYNVFVGANCGFYNAEKGYNTFVGTAAGEYFKGNYNTFLGYYAGRNASTVRTGDRNVFIGYNAGSASGSISNKLYIANSNTNTPLIYGDFSTGNIGLGTNAPGNHRIYVTSALGGATGSSGHFENSAADGIAFSAVNTTSSDVTALISQQGTGDIFRCDTYTGGWKAVFKVNNTGKLFAPYLNSGTGSALYLTTGNEIVKLSSSKKFKKDIVPLEFDISKFMKLKPVSFRWNEKSAEENKPDYGLIAEEVEMIDPELALYTDKSEIEGVNYHKISVMLVKVTQDQQSQIEELKREIRELRELVKK